MSTNDNHYCVCMTQADVPEADRKTLQGSKAALLNANRWSTGTTITVKFLEGDASLQQRVKGVAKEWTAPGMANLTLDFRNSGDTDIRIAFQQGNGSWSYIGTVCRQIQPQETPTMNYGWLTPASSDDEIRRVVLHEFGHALGLIHEHQNPKGGIQWNRDAVIRDLSGPPNDWDLATIENNMFRYYPEEDITGTNLDSTSIMMYPIPAAWTLGGFSAGLNSTLSDSDKGLIRTAYPA
jgi:serralysin